MSEKILAEGSTSQTINLGVFISSIFLITLPLVVYRYLNVKNTGFRLTKEKLTLYRWRLKHFKEEIDLPAIKSVTLRSNFFMQLFSLSDLLIEFKEPQKTPAIIPAIKDAQQLRSKILRISKKSE
jgi:uncharacterized membrane protein YdbT with pleckstrin-like domain